jgi:transcription elongation factor GreB
VAEKEKKPLTRAGYLSLAKEFNHLRDVERPKVVSGVATAAAEGDRSENAEYIYGKKRLREIDKRLRYLTGLLDNVRVVDPEKLTGDRICFGATAVVIDEAGVRKEYTLVGVGEADVAGAGTISWLSPVGKALMGKKIGDFVTIRIPSGETELEIVDIKFAGRSILSDEKLS